MLGMINGWKKKSLSSSSESRNCWVVEKLYAAALLEIKNAYVGEDQNLREACQKEVEEMIKERDILNLLGRELNEAMHHFPVIIDPCYDSKFHLIMNLVEGEKFGDIITYGSHQLVLMYRLRLNQENQSAIFNDYISQLLSIHDLLLKTTITHNQLCPWNILVKKPSNTLVLMGSPPLRVHKIGNYGNHGRKKFRSYSKWQKSFL